MALPTTIGSTITGGFNHHVGPFISGGNVYVVLRDSTASSENVQVFKATDPTDSFSIQDSGNEPTGVEQESIWVDRDGDLLHILTHDTNDATAVEYHRFDTSSDTWTITNDLVMAYSGGDTPPTTVRGGSISQRGAGDPIVAFHRSLDDKVMGTDRRRMTISTRSGGGTWTDRGLAVGAATDEINYSGASSILGTSDGIHFFIHENDGGTADILARTIDSSNALSTIVRLGVTIATNREGFSKPITFDDSGTQRIYLPYQSTTTGAGPGNVWRGEEDGSNDFANTSKVLVTDVGNDVRANGNTPVFSLALNGTQAHFLWANVDDTFDVYRDEASLPHAVGDWGTDVEERDGVAAGSLSGNIFTRSGSVKFAFIYIDTFVSTYDEIDLGGGVGPVWPSPTKQMAHLLLR